MGNEIRFQFTIIGENNEFVKYLPMEMRLIND